MKVSEACRLCYAETFSKRVGQSVWGADAPRRFFGEKHWNEPINWNKKAEKEGQRKRVFCASMADWAEDRRDLDPWREKLWDLIAATPWLDWLLLTKRHDKIVEFVPKAWLDDWPANVWPGITVETQKWADIRIPHLLRLPAQVRWLSVEPLLGPLDLERYLLPDYKKRGALNWAGGVNWVIVGGESGHGAKPDRKSVV